MYFINDNQSDMFSIEKAIDNMEKLKIYESFVPKEVNIVVISELHE